MLVEGLSSAQTFCSVLHGGPAKHPAVDAQEAVRFPRRLTGSLHTVQRSGGQIIRQTAQELDNGFLGRAKVGKEQVEAENF